MIDFYIWRGTTEQVFFSDLFIHCILSTYKVNLLLKIKKKNWDLKNKKVQPNLHMFCHFGNLDCKSVEVKDI